MLCVLSSSLFRDNSSKAQYDASEGSGNWLFDNVPNWSDYIVQDVTPHRIIHTAVWNNALSLVRFLELYFAIISKPGPLFFLREIKFRLAVERHIFVVSKYFCMCLFTLVPDDVLLFTQVRNREIY
jgi:hypothetical protein